MVIEEALTTPANTSAYSFEKQKELKIFEPIKFFDPENPPRDYIKAKNILKRE